MDQSVQYEFAAYLVPLEQSKTEAVTTRLTRATIGGGIPTALTSITSQRQ